MSLLGPADVVRLPWWVVLRFDPVRRRHVLLAPERVLFPCPTTVTILQRLGEGRRLADLAAELAREFDAPAGEILEDVIALLEELACGCLLEVRRCGHDAAAERVA